MSVGEDQVDITWPLTDVDARGVLEAIKLARAGDVLIDLDMGRLQSDPEPRPWHVTDLAVIAPSVLPGARSRKRPACST